MQDNPPQKLIDEINKGLKVLNKHPSNRDIKLFFERKIKNVSRCETIATHLEICQSCQRQGKIIKNLYDLSTTYIDLANNRPDSGDILGRLLRDLAHDVDPRRHQDRSDLIDHIIGGSIDDNGNEGFLLARKEHLSYCSLCRIRLMWYKALVCLKLIQVDRP